MRTFSLATLGGGVSRPPLIRRPWVQHGVTAVVALGVAKEIGLLKKLPPEIGVAVIPLTVVIYLFIREPKWPLIALVGATCFGLYRYGFRFGPLNVRATDLPYIFLVPWALLLRRRHGSPSRNLIGQQYLALFLGAVGFTLFVALVRTPDDAARLVVAYFRLFTTVSLVWIVPQVVTKHEDVLFVLRALALMITAELAFSLARNPAGAAADRLRGMNGPNAEGLLAVVLIVIALYAPVPKTRSAKVAMLAVGVPALFFSRSIGALTAMGVVFGVFGLKRWRHAHAARTSGLLRPARLIVLGFGLITLVSIVRPLDLPTSSYFKRSSAGSRVIVGAAGVKIFFTEPMFGVGWQRSSRPDIIATRSLVEALQHDFPGYPASFFPVVGTTSITVHNAYVQVLAETGLIGTAVFIGALVAVSRRGRKLLAELSGTEQVAARAVAISIVACLVWLNDNPIFGAQPETITLSLMLGLLASMAALHRRRVAEGDGTEVEAEAGAAEAATASASVVA